ncbi:hypothetical protein U5801_18470 [Lamprobacter modestohalophilus]|uniref:hypothetical protein n=1 Tax=Lamprobacter modestohalophilus TaxID=1064514 RepID=UPI002ADEF1D2|nr:hypothetical protein [Lamprobacter modestohalophilus]MEA1051771.1 hypothetical protein [Lamprobacter modestohalophilus]
MLSNTTLKRTSALLAFAMIAGCSTPPDKISASYVSPMQYSDYSCDQIKREMGRVQRQLAQVTGAQQKHADNDAVAMGVGLVLFWPALFFLAGDDQKEELSRIKGEYEALQQAAIQQNCEIAPEARRAG